MGELLEFLPYEVHEFNWGSAIKTTKGDWEKIFINEGDILKELDVTKLKVILHENGIEFI